MLSNKIQSQILDPSTSSTYRKEFNIGGSIDGVISSNIRLIDIGVTTGVGNERYNALSGAYGCLKRIELLNGNKVLGIINENNLWAAFKNVNADNKTQKYVQTPLSKGRLGFTWDNIVDSNSSSDNRDSRRVMNFWPFNEDSNEITSSEETTCKAWMDLKSWLGVLNAHSFLPMKYFKNLRLVVHYETNKKFAVDRSNNYTPIEPSLIVDVVKDENLANDLTMMWEGKPYIEVEQDSVIIPAIGTASNGSSSDLTTTQQLDLLINGFDNKSVNRLVLMKTPTVEATYTRTGSDNYQFGPLGSISCYNEKINLRVNGMNLLSGDGLDTPNKKLSYLTDTWGTCNLISNDQDYVDSADVYGSSTQNRSMSNVALLGFTDFIGLDLAGEKVQELQVLYQRESVPDITKQATVAEQKNAFNNQQLVLNVFGEVQKALILDKNNNQVDVVYI